MLDNQVHRIQFRTAFHEQRTPNRNELIRLCLKCQEPFSTSTRGWKKKLQLCPFCHKLPTNKPNK